MTAKLFLLAFVTFAASLTFACGSGDDSTEAGTSTGAATAGDSKPAAGQEGGECGGAGEVSCQHGFFCKKQDDKFAEDPGVCVKAAPKAIGSDCDGSATSCNSGLHCVKQTGESSGICSGPAFGEEGAPCGGRTDERCNAGLDCVIKTGQQEGTCAKK